MSRGLNTASALFGFALIAVGNLNAAGPEPVLVKAQQGRFDPAYESFQFNEARRQSQIARQLDLNYRMARSSGYGPQYPGVFEPWPRVEGDIYGYRLPGPIAQPVGHESAQVGPNRWIYRPFYLAGAVPQTVPVVSPNVRKAAPAMPLREPNKPPQVQLPAPSDLSEPEVPRPILEKPATKRPGPREF